MIHPDEVVAIEIMRPGPAGDGVTSGEATQILEAIDEFQSTTIPQNLGDLNNVNVPSPSNGQVLTYVTANSRWQAATPANLIVEEGAGETVVNSSARRLLFRNGVAASQSGVVSERVVIDLEYAGTGSAVTPARSDHTHNPAIMFLETFAATGNLSSGTRTVLSSSIGPFLNGVAYDIHGTFLVRCRGAVNSGTITLSCRIGGSASFPARSRVVQVVGGVPVDQIIHFHRTITGDGTSATVTFQVTYSSGDPTDIRDGEVSIVATPRR